jgi:hypothetical protein
MLLLHHEKLNFAHINTETYKHYEVYAIGLTRFQTHGFEVTVFRRRNSRDMKTYKGEATDPQELAKWIAQSMAIGVGPDQIHELSQDMFTNAITGDVPILLLLRKTERFRGEHFVETDEMYESNKRATLNAESALHEAYEAIQGRVKVFIANTGRNFIKDIATFVNHPINLSATNKYEPKIVLLKPNHLAGYKEDVRHQHDSEQEHHHQIQKYKMNDPITKENISEFIDDYNAKKIGEIK